MSFRPTTLERACQLADGGGCVTISAIKFPLQAEGYAGIQEPLFSPSTGNALRDRCKASVPDAAGAKSALASPAAGGGDTVLVL